MLESSSFESEEVVDGLGIAYESEEPSTLDPESLELVEGVNEFGVMLVLEPSMLDPVEVDVGLEVVEELEEDSTLDPESLVLAEGVD